MNTKRHELYQEIPLATPYSLHMFVSFYCNFKCDYCLHSLSEQELMKKNFKKQYMDYSVFKKAIDDATLFGENIKALIFAGHGEPLLNKDIDKMVAYAKQSKKFDRVEIVTNGILLTKEMSDRLINSGLDRLRISLQGLDEEKYMEVSAANIDFCQFVKNIEYFYQKKTNTEIYVKIIDVALDESNTQKKFHDIFDPIADITAIEYAIPFVNEIDYSEVGDISKKCKQGHAQHSEICSMPFYMMVVNPNGDIVPCCSTDIPCILGNIQEDSLVEIWNSDKRKNLLIQQLHGTVNIPVCKECSVPAFGLQQGDYLDEHTKELLERFSL